jgi:GTP-binding protein HflX
LFERPESGERAVLVHVNFPDAAGQEDLHEFTELVHSAGALAVATITGTRTSPEPRLFVGQGKAGEILAAVEQHKADVVIFNHSLSPSQERNLERLLSCRVLARTGLILDIFAQRARSFEGKLQVELAQLRHLSTRLVRGWTHLERQKGGIGLRGPGETQLESDRRMLNARIKVINRRLGKVERQRDQGRRARQRAEVPTVSLVGYTNAGKSTLFNALSGADAYVADQLFATRKKPARQTCYCTWWMRRTRKSMHTSSRSMRCWPRSGPMQFHSCASTTRSIWSISRHMRKTARMEGSAACGCRR